MIEKIAKYKQILIQGQKLKRRWRKNHKKIDNRQIDRKYARNRGRTGREIDKERKRIQKFIFLVQTIFLNKHP